MKGLAAVLEFAEDLEIEIPNLWSYLAQLIAPLFTHGDCTLSRLNDVCKPLQGIGKCSKLVAAILEEASHKTVS